MFINKLYKYRTFGVNSLNELCESEIHFSDPKKFNDPLDCSPTLINDVDLNELEKLCHRIIVKNHDKNHADNEINSCRHHTIEYGDYKKDHEVKEYYIRLLVNEIKHQLDHMMKSKGIFSLSSQWNSPLMWSHYADEHRGICIEYDISRSVCKPPKSVDYKSTRGINISWINDWIQNDSVVAKENIEHKYFYTKAGQWDYENEWRYVLDSQGSIPVPFHLSAVYFGMRCDSSVVSSIVKLLSGAGSSLKFYSTFASQDSFELNKRELDIEELMASTPRVSVALAFGNIHRE